MSSTLTGNYGDYMPVAGHPLVRIAAYKLSDGFVCVWYLADREPLLALGVVPAERLTWPRQRKTGKGSRGPRTARSVYVDAYWRSQNGLPVRRFRVLIRDRLANVLQLPGVCSALQAEEQREREREAWNRELEAPQSPAPMCPVLRLVVDNTRTESHSHERA